MLRNILDASLLIYRYEDWKSKNNYCLERMRSLFLHRDFLNRYQQRIAISKEFLALVMQHFPWSHSNIPGFRDFRLFITADMQRMGDYICKSDRQYDFETEIKPDGIVCTCIEEGVLKEWVNLLYGCLNDNDNSINQIATWDSDEINNYGKELELEFNIIGNTPEKYIYKIPVVWNEDTWFKRLATQDWWPDIHKCIKLYYETNDAIKALPDIRNEPFGIEYEEIYGDIVGLCNTESMKLDTIKALTKLVYGIRDKALCYKKIGEDRYRFRVTIHYRMHCRFDKQRQYYILEEFAQRESVIDGIG